MQARLLWAYAAKNEKVIRKELGYRHTELPTETRLALSSLLRELVAVEVGNSREVVGVRLPSAGMLLVSSTSAHSMACGG